MNSNAWRAVVAALTLIVMTSGSTATSSLFVIYRQEWGLTSADIAIVFSAYVGTLLPTLVFFGNLAERFGRRRMAAAGITSMAVGIATLVLAHDLQLLIVARLFQGLGVGLSIGAVSAAFAETYRGKLPQGNALQSITAVGLFAGPVVSALCYNLGWGLNLALVPGLVSVIALLALTRFLKERSGDAGSVQPAEEPFSAAAVARALRFAMPVVFVSWAGLSLYLSLVPSYLAATLHAINPLIGAGAVVAAQLASLVATLVLGKAAPEKTGIVGSIVTVAGLALLVIGTSTNIWALVVAATILVGAGGGVASAAAFGIATRIGRGQRSRIFARMFVAAYLGYSIPALALGAIAVRTSFATGFISIIVLLAFITAALPFVRERRTHSCALAPQPAAA
jgi:Na+/melibiose symporter-like transporter